MLILPSNARASDLVVYPSNYLSKDADITRTWYIKYRYYNAAYPRGKQVVIKSMNRLKDLRLRQQTTLDLYRKETDRLFKGYDPTKPKEKPITELTLFEALADAAKHVNVIQKTKTELKGMVRRIQACNPQTDPPISEVTRKTIKKILESCYENPRFTDNTFNHYHKYLSILFNHLREHELVETNYLRDIAKKATVSKLREILTDQERQKMEQHLFHNYYTFWRFITVFLYSGARIAELLRLERTDVYLEEQFFKITIIKGKNRREVLKVIPNKVLPLWKELLSEPGGPCLFSKGLRPGKKAVREEQIDRRWRTHVKDKLKLNIDLYSLKHLYLDKIECHLGIKTASAAADHTTSAVSRRFYTVGKDARLREQLKNFEI